MTDHNKSPHKYEKSNKNKYTINNLTDSGNKVRIEDLHTQNNNNEAKPDQY